MTKKIETGNSAYWAPEGFVVRIDTSWDHRGWHVACRECDVISHHPGSPSSLGVVEIREDAEILLGSEVFKLAPNPGPIGNGGLGYSWSDRLTGEEAEEIFAAWAAPY